MVVSRRAAILGMLSALATGRAAVTGVQRTASSDTPATTAIPVQPAGVTRLADRLTPPWRVDWLGGSDIAWRDVSLPGAFTRRVPAAEGRTIAMRTRVRQALMPAGAAELVAEAVEAGTQAMILSLNLAWLHWDELGCAGITPPRRRYDCLLTPISPAVTTQRAEEIRAVITAAAAPGVPVYIYVQPHSTDVLTDPVVSRRIAEAESTVAGFDPHLPHVRLVAQTFTRWTPAVPEGVAFYDMVHPTAAGAEVLADWLAADIPRFWASTGLAR
jgi:hypothetical protein